MKKEYLDFCRLVEKSKYKTKNLTLGELLLGYPAMKMDTQLEIYKQLRRLPRLLTDVARLKKAVSKTDPSD